MPSEDMTGQAQQHLKQITAYTKQPMASCLQAHIDRFQDLKESCINPRPRSFKDRGGKELKPQGENTHHTPHIHTHTPPHTGQQGAYI